MIEIFHDVSYDQWYLSMCTTHIQPPRMQYVALMWCVHICQDARAKSCNTELAISKLYGHVWTTLDNRIRCFFFFLEFFALLDRTSTGTVQPIYIMLTQEFFSYVLIFGRSNISNVLLGLVWDFEFEGLLQLQMPKQMLKWCASEVFPQTSTRSMTMNATTIKVNGKL